MTRLIVVLLVGALAWMVWWAVGKSAYEQGLSAWIEQRRGDGWVADVANLNTAGFPNRFDTTLTDIRLADPDTGIAWSAPRLQFLSLAYKPHQVISVVEGPHRFSTPLGGVDITHEDARASLFLKPETALGLDRAILIVTGLALDADAGWTTKLASGRFAAESVAAAANSYRVGADIEGLTPSRPLQRLLDPAGVLPETVESLRLDATLEFDRPWDRFAIEDARPQPRRIELSDLSAIWGTTTFRAVGDLDIDMQGFPTGDITIRAVEWRRILDMAVSSGVLPESAAGPLERGLELMSGPRDTLDATISFGGGLTRLGIIPIGPAPRILIR